MVNFLKEWSVKTNMFKHLTIQTSKKIDRQAYTAPQRQTDVSTDFVLSRKMQGAFDDQHKKLQISRFDK